MSGGLVWGGALGEGHIGVDALDTCAATSLVLAFASAAVAAFPTAHAVATPARVLTSTFCHSHHL